MKQLFGTCVFAICGVVFLAHATAQDGPDFPKGTFTAPLDGSDAVLYFGKDAKFSFAIAGFELLQGTYTVTKGMIEFTDEKGPAAGTGEYKTGKYEWKYENKKLTFTTVQEKNKGRQRWATTSPWILQSTK
jgi:hypothetical protein